MSTGFVDTQRMLGVRLQPDNGSVPPLDDEDLQVAAHVYGQWVAAAAQRTRQALCFASDPLTH